MSCSQLINQYGKQMSLVLGSSLFFFKVKDGLNSLGPCTVIFPFCLQTKGNPIV